MAGKTEWFPDASHFDGKDVNVVHHGIPEGTAEHVSYYPRANRFTFDNLNITHFGKGGTPPPPLPPSVSRPHPPASVTIDDRSTVHRWLDGVSSYSRPPAQHRGLTVPAVSVTEKRPPFPENPHYGSFSPDETLPSAPPQTYSPPAGSQNTPPNRDGESDELDHGDEDDVWAMSDDEDAVDVEKRTRQTTDHVYVPRLLEYMATKNPSYSPSQAELLNIWKEAAVPGIPPKGYILATSEGRINAWRNGFLEHGLRYLDGCVLPGLDDKSPEARRRWAQSMKPSGRRKLPYPFYFKDTVRRKDSFLSDFVAFTMGNHLRAISVLPEAERSNEFPMGALAVALHACERAIDLWEAGVRNPGDCDMQGLTIHPDVWQLLTTHLSDRDVRQKKILDAAAHQLEVFSQFIGS